MRGLNSRPLACEASVITTTPTRPVMAFKHHLISFSIINKQAILYHPPPLPTVDETHKRKSSRSEHKASAPQPTSTAYHGGCQHDRVEQNGSTVLVEPATRPPVQRIRMSLLPQQIESHPHPRHSHQHVPKSQQHTQLLRLLLLLQRLDRPPQRAQRDQQGSHVHHRHKSIQNTSHTSGSVVVACQQHEE